jgi:hypothetical protein
MPEGASFEPKYIADNAAGNVFDGMVLDYDTEVFHAGAQSLVVPSGDSQYRALVVPVPGNTFWVRLYVRLSSEFGDQNHDSLYLASRKPAGEYNGDSAIEVSEQSNQLLLNKNDALYSASGPGDPAGTGASGPKLPADTWLCMETLFDGATNTVEVYQDGDLLLEAMNYGSGTAFESFRFGYIKYNTARTVWYDDVVVSATRVGCM